jgi:hypothetical protein
MKLNYYLLQLICRKLIQLKTKFTLLNLISVFGATWFFVKVNLILLKN